MRDFATIKNDFPIFSQAEHEKLVYLDNAATMQVPEQVLTATAMFVSNKQANVHRGTYTLAHQATEAYEAVREKVQTLLHAKKTSEIIFTSGTTKSLNMVAQILHQQWLQPGDEIVISILEHHSQFIPWQQIAKLTHTKLHILPIDKDGLINVQAAKQIINDKTKVLAISHVSNVLGTIQPLKALGALIHQHGGLFIVDGAQAVGHFPVDVTALDADFYAISAHKIGGPTGVGVLYGKEKLLQQFEPVEFGGEMIQHVSVSEAIWQTIPYKFEAGTPNIVGVIGLGAAIAYLQTLGIENIQQHEQEVIQFLLPRLQESLGVTVYGSRDASHRIALFSFNLESIHPHDVATFFDSEQIAVRAGHHCAEPLIQALQVPATVRASFAIYNDISDAKKLLQAIEKTKDFFNE